MQKIIKNHWLISIILILSVGCILYYCFAFIDNQKKIETLELQRINYCNSGNVADNDIQICEHFLLSVSQEEGIEVDFYTMMSDILLFNIQFFNAIAFLIIIIPTLTNLCKILKNKYIIHSCTRESYQSFLKNYFFHAYRYIWILPVIACILILTCIMNTTFDPSYSLIYGSSIWKSDIIYYPIVFVALYLLNIFLYSCTFINIALIIVRKQHSYIKAVILSFITYIGLELFFEVIVNVLLCQTILKIEIGHLFNIVNLFTFSDTYGTLALMIFTITMFTLSSIGVYFTYRNKEKLVIDCEMNN